MTGTRLIFDEISRERASQDEEWGGADHDDSHERADWVKFIEKQCRLARTAKDRPLDDYESRMVKIAALAVAAIESNRRERMTTGADWAEDRERYGMMQLEVVPYRPTARDTLAAENTRLQAERDEQGRLKAQQTQKLEVVELALIKERRELTRLQERLEAAEKIVDYAAIQGSTKANQYLAKYAAKNKGGSE